MIDPFYSPEALDLFEKILKENFVDIYLDEICAFHLSRLRWEQFIHAMKIYKPNYTHWPKRRDLFFFFWFAGTKIYANHTIKDDVVILEFSNGHCAHHLNFESIYEYLMNSKAAQPKSKKPMRDLTL